MTQQHTPVPYHVSGSDVRVYGQGNRLVADLYYDGEIPIREAEANAAFIIQACNAHDNLLAAAKVASEVLHSLHPQEHHIPVGRGICTWGPCKVLFDAITKATSPQAR